jgi:hypothetical protein
MEANDDADTQLADDFIVDAGSGGWNIDKVEVKGSPGPPLSGVTVLFYTDAAGCLPTPRR